MGERGGPVLGRRPASGRSPASVNPASSVGRAGTLQAVRARWVTLRAWAWAMASPTWRTSSMRSSRGVVRGRGRPRGRGAPRRRQGRRSGPGPLGLLEVEGLGDAVVAEVLDHPEFGSAPGGRRSCSSRSWPYPTGRCGTALRARPGHGWRGKSLPARTFVEELAELPVADPAHGLRAGGRRSRGRRRSSLLSGLLMALPLR